MGQYRCNRCGQEWDEHPMLGVPCPKCRAHVGVWCSSSRPSEHRVRFGTQIHVEREQAAMDAGYLTKCPGNLVMPDSMSKPNLRRAREVTAQMELCLPTAASSR